jgi:hypothetical protein
MLPLPPSMTATAGDEGDGSGTAPVGPPSCAKVCSRETGCPEANLGCDTVVKGVAMGVVVVVVVVVQPDTTSIAAQQAANLVARLREGNKGKTPNDLAPSTTLARK